MFRPASYQWWWDAAWYLESYPDMNNEPDKKHNHDNPDGSDGQNPIWPGEGLRKPGEAIKEKDEETTTIIPIIR